MRLLATFSTRDIADSMKELLVQHGYAPEDMILMANRGTPDPPEDAALEAGNEGEGGFAEFEEKVGKAFNSMLGRKPAPLEGDGSEGEGNGGALLTLTVASEVEARRAMALLEPHNPADLEVVDSPVG